MEGSIISGPGSYKLLKDVSLIKKQIIALFEYKYRREIKACSMNLIEQCYLLMYSDFLMSNTYMDNGILTGFDHNILAW